VARGSPGIKKPRLGLLSHVTFFIEGHELSEIVAQSNQRHITEIVSA